MTRIHLNAETLAKFQSAQGRVLLCDEAGNPFQFVELEAYPNCEPVLSDEERKRRRTQPGGLTTAEFVAYLQNKGSK